MGSGLHFTEMELINYDWNPVCSYEIQWTLVVYSKARYFCYAFFLYVSIYRDYNHVAHKISFIVVCTLLLSFIEPKIIIIIINLYVLG